MHSPFILITLLLIAYLSYIKELSTTKTCINLQSEKVYKSRLEKACLALNSSLNLAQIIRLILSKRRAYA